jgi:RNA polymerase sigma-70 factor (ECF subfamily)
MIETEAPTFPLVEQTKVAEKTEKESKVLEALTAYQEKVFLTCLGFSRNPADAEDLTQEVYLKALRKIDSLTDLSLIKFWLFRVTRNTCLDFSRKRKFRRNIPLEPEHEQYGSKTPESQLVSREQLRSLKAAIQQLPKKQREVFILKEYGDLSYQEIAETLKIKLGTVMSRLNRARQTIKDRMKGEDNEKN